jgi:hypothetical protein
MIQIIINDSIKNNILLEINENNSVYEIKYLLYKKYNYKIEKFLLIFGGKILEDEKPLTYYNIENNSTIDILFKIKGGNMIGYDLIINIILVLLILIFIIVFLLTGIIPLIAEYMYTNTSNFLNILNEKINDYIINIDSLPLQTLYRILHLIYIIITKCILFLASFGFIYLIVSYMTSFVLFILSNKILGKECDSMKTSKETGYYIGLFYMLVYYGLKLNIFLPIVLLIDKLPECFKPTDIIKNILIGLSKNQRLTPVRIILTPLFLIFPSLLKIINMLSDKVNDNIDENKLSIYITKIKSGGIDKDSESNKMIKMVFNFFMELNNIKLDSPTLESDLMLKIRENVVVLNNGILTGFLSTIYFLYKLIIIFWNVIF